MNSTFFRMVKAVAQYKKLFYLGVFLVTVVAIIDTLPPRLYSWAIDNIIEKGDKTYLVHFILVFLATALLNGITIYLFIRVCGLLEVKFSRQLRNDIFKKVQRLHLQYFNENQDGWIIARITSDVSKLSEVMSWKFVDNFYFIVLIIVSIVSVFTYNVQAGLIILVIYPILLFVLYIIKNKVLAQHRKARKHNSNVISKFNELINGILTVKTIAVEDVAYEEFQDESLKLKYYSRKAVLYSGLFVPTILILGYAMLGLVLGYGINENIIGDMSIGEVSAMVTYVLILLEITSEFTNNISQLQHARANAERIYTLLDTEEEIVDSEAIEQAYGSVLEDLKIKDKLSGDIRLDNVSFSYKNGEEIFKDFDLTLPSGKSIALVGATGSGKTTLVNLISRFYDVDEGTIHFGDKNLKDCSINWLHYNIGHVLQHPFLFDGTVYENIKYNSDASEEKVMEICLSLGLDVLLDKLEDGIHTSVGEGGSKLSVGEKQLISFARALINDPSIVILDEATSSIDYDSEEVIQNAIYKMMDSRSMIIIAHRLSTIEKCDEILYLKNGKIVERGNHQELMKLQGNYYNLVKVATTL